MGLVFGFWVFGFRFWGFGVLGLGFWGFGDWALGFGGVRSKEPKFPPSSAAPPIEFTLKNLIVRPSVCLSVRLTVQ